MAGLLQVLSETETGLGKECLQCVYLMGQTGILVDWYFCGFIWVTVGLSGIIVGIPKVTWVSYIRAIRGHSKSNWGEMGLI